jgi:NAD(P)H-hydrate epimerase
MIVGGESMLYPSTPADIPCVTKAQMVEVDRMMIEDYHIALAQMMENAGRSLASLARQRFLGGSPAGKRIVVVAGRGGNGGGALVCARHLTNWGGQVSVVVSRPVTAFDGVPGHQLDIVRRIEIPVLEAGAVDRVIDGGMPLDLIIDGLIGYSLEGAPRGAAARLIRWVNAQDAPVLALDTPSGLDTTTGQPQRPAIRADATLTLALPKTGLREASAVPFVGALYLADIGVPPALYARPGLDLIVGPVFARSGILRVPDPGV